MTIIIDDERLITLPFHEINVQNSWLITAIFNIALRLKGNI